uniref:Uncharacterized protein n=1 Tax=Chromera velia CCMP2878 TaxID=1169474 RepID=A0A0G4FMU0_9ALVE|eukprot:Cvel_17855.t1-p1 / transcript=Cvel_17855.t1 / gene=Cvel_17855 / organism=Chromera_velia_CCMP2878 / gene_product=hypothetical protein / transcript_product=hypothetical protein / location=Cvel_scaffold1448:3489-6449(+) / protein_length=606 / sequence_SO=supercontig / SO=protein_coding / is_pseudo=false
MDTEPGEVPVGVISSGGTGSSLETVGPSGYGPVDRLVSELRELRLGWASMKEGGEFRGDFHVGDQLMEAGALSALIEDRPNMRGPVGDRNVFVTSSRIYCVLRAVVGDDAPTFPDVESRREFLLAALGGRVEFLGETALRAKFWYVPVRHPLTGHWFGVLVKNGEQSEGSASQASGGRVGMISLDCLRNLRLSPALVDLEKKRVFRRISLFATKLFKEVRGCEPRSWLRFLNSIPGETVTEVTVPQQLGEDSLHLCGDHVLSYLIIVLRLQTSELESLFQSHSGSPPVLPPERGPIAQDLRKRLDSLIGVAPEVAPQSGRHRRPGGGSIETEGFGGEIQSGRTAEIVTLGRTGGVLGRELDAVKERFLTALHEREEDKSRATRAPAYDPLVGLPLVFGQISSETDSSTRGPSSCPPPPTWSRIPRSRAKAKADAASSVIQKRPHGGSQSADVLSDKLPPPGQEATAGLSKTRAVSAVAATTEHIQAPVCDPPTVSSGYANGAGAPVLTDGDTAMTRAEHLVLSALRIAEAKESAVATAGKLPDLSVLDPSSSSAALGITVGARSPLLCPRSAGYTTEIVAQGESLAESATRMAIEEEMIESEQEEG